MIRRPKEQCFTCLFESNGELAVYVPGGGVALVEAMVFLPPIPNVGDYIKDNKAGEHTGEPLRVGPMSTL